MVSLALRLHMRSKTFSTCFWRERGHHSVEMCLGRRGLRVTWGYLDQVGAGSKGANRGWFIWL